MSKQRHRIRVAKDYLSFSAAHFISLAGSPCERLHGHNYRVAVEVEADLAKEGLIFDFALLKRIVRQITDQLDHRVLLPAKGDEISTEKDAQLVHVRMKERQWSFPLADCFFLPAGSTTAELLASWMARQVEVELEKQTGIIPKALRLEVEESPGQSATYEIIHEP